MHDVQQTPAGEATPPAQRPQRGPIARGIALGAMLGAATAAVALLVPAVAIVAAATIGGEDFAGPKIPGDVGTGLPGIVLALVVIAFLGGLVVVPVGAAIGAVTGAVIGCVVRGGVRRPRTAALLSAGIAVAMWALVFAAYVLRGIDSAVTGQALFFAAWPAMVGALLAARLGWLIARGPGAPGCCATLRTARARRRLTPAR